MLRAYDKATGQAVGAVYSPGAAERIADDLQGQRQTYIVVAVSGGAYSASTLRSLWLRRLRGGTIYFP